MIEAVLSAAPLAGVIIFFGAVVAEVKFGVAPSLAKQIRSAGLAITCVSVGLIVVADVLSSF